VKLLAEYLEGLGEDNTLVLFVDAYDVLLLEPFAHLKRRFVALGAAVLFSGEAASSPDTSATLLYAQVDCCGSVDRQGSLPYLNSG
jgi:hypothetical protein